MAVWEDEEDQFFSCPRNFITDNIVEFYDIYYTYKEIPGCAPQFEKLSNKFVEAVKYYNSKYNFYISEKIKTPKKDKDDLKVFRDTYNGRNKGKSKLSG